MPIYYFTIDGPEGDKIVSLMANLSENFGVTVKDALMVETDIDHLVPMLERLGDDRVDKGEVAPAKVCQRCGKPVTGRGRSRYCSRKCYTADYRARNKPAKKGYRTSVETQDATVRNRTAEDERIEAVVAKAKLTAPSADFEHMIKSGGSIMARKL